MIRTRTCPNQRGEGAAVECGCGSPYITGHPFCVVTDQGNCTFCGNRELAIDDMGLFYIKAGKVEGCCCHSCLDGEPGRQHRKQFGTGDR